MTTKEQIEDTFLNTILELSDLNRMQSSEDMQEALEGIHILTTAYKNAQENKSNK